MLSAAAWFLLLSLIGWVSLPLAYRLLPFLQDRGIAFLRPLGLLLWAFIFWLLASLQLLHNTIGGLLAALLLLAALSAWAGWGCRAELAAWLRQQRGAILAVEGLFLAAFVAWALVRAANPDIQYTEKTMEMAFINGILRSETFPPLDPWLSGYSISYYYFGYVMVAALAKLSATPGPVAFNLAHAAWFAMSAAAAYGVLYSLLSRYFSQVSASLRRWALLGPLFLLLISNMEGVLGVMHARGMFWQPTNDGGYSSTFWTWLGIPDLDQPPAQPLGWQPHRGTWDPSWRASRVLVDTRFDGQTIEIIDEFPFFSYLLGDLHPHVLSMPFVLLAMALALNLYQERQAQAGLPPPWQLRLRQPGFWPAAVVLGGLAFLNTWDFPMYVALFAGASALGLRSLGNTRWKDLAGEFLTTGLLVGVVGGLLYLPFYLGFKSQAGGILPSLIFFTPGKNFWIMFAPLVLPILAGLVNFHRTEGRFNLPAGIKAALGVVLVLWVGQYLFGGGLFALGQAGARLQAGGQGLAASVGSLLQQAGSALQLDVQGAWGASTGALLAASLVKRLASPGTWLTLLAVLAAAFSLLAARGRQETGRAQMRYEQQTLGGLVEPGDRRAVNFVVWMAALGALLALFPEFFYLRDQFGTRMNTIFKFYMQVWVLWSLAAAFFSVVLLRRLSGTGGWLFRAAWALLAAAALVYPLFMLPAKTQGFRPAEWTLDGSRYLEYVDPAMPRAVEWLRAAPLGVLAEGVSGSYSYHVPRYSVFSGQPAVLGWPGHESQWGRSEELGSRQADMQELFTSRSWQEVEPILERYRIRYIVVGPVERATYNNVDQGLILQEEKFRLNLPIAFEQPNITIFEVPQSFAAAQVGSAR